LSLFKKLYRIIILGDDNPSDSAGYERIQLKQLCLISAILSALATLNGLLIANAIYIIYTASVAFGYCIIYMIYKSHWDRLGDYFISVFGVIWSSVALMLFGYYIGTAATFLATFYISYVLWTDEKKIRNILLLFNALAFFIITTLAYYIEPLTAFDSPVDQGFVYLGCILWLVAISNIYENQKSEIIKSVKNKNAELKRTTEELERFTYIASHDLKSPIRTVVSFLGLLEKDIKELDRSDLLETLDYAKTGAHQMSSLVNDILEWSSINSENGSVQYENFNLTELVSIAIKNLDQEIRSKNAQISISELFSYQCNKNEFVAIFQNIVHNAIKYNEEEVPRVSIWSDKLKDAYRIHIKDNGIGIDDQYKEQIFEYFRRLHSAANYEGTGLGLGLCKKIIEKYEGKIYVEANENEEGSTFIIELPYAVDSVNLLDEVYAVHSN